MYLLSSNLTYLLRYPVYRLIFLCFIYSFFFSLLQSSFEFTRFCFLLIYSNRFPLTNNVSFPLLYLQIPWDDGAYPCCSLHTSLNKYLFIPILQFDNITLLPRRLYIFLFGSQLKKNSYPHLFAMDHQSYHHIWKQNNFLNCIFSIL